MPWAISQFLLAIFLGVCPVHAANKYWVGTSGTTNSPTGGLWQTTSPVVWSDGSVPTANAGWTDGDAAFFGGANGNYRIKVGGPINAASLRFSASGYVLTNDLAHTITASTSPFLIVDPGRTNTIGTNVTISVGFPATATLGAAGGTPGGTLIIENGGVVQETTTRPLNVGGTATLVVVKTGGVLKNASASAGTPVITVGGAVGDDATVSVDGGTVSLARTTASIWIPTGPAAVAGDIRGTLTLNTGAVTTTGGFVALANGPGNSGVFNLNGGTLTASQVIGGAGDSTLNFNGGTLRALSSQTAFVTNVTRINVRNGGAVIDDNGVNIVISENIQHSNIGGDNATDGGLTKLGGGTLTLAGTNTYTGITTVAAGTLGVSGSIRGPVVISPNGNLAAGNAIGPITISNSLNLSGTITLRLDRSAGITNDFVQGVTALIYGGRLTVVLAAGSLNAGDMFTLFKAGSIGGAFNQFTLPILPDGLAFDTTQLTVDGTLRVVAATSILPTLKATPAGSNLFLAWSTQPLRQYQLITATNLTQPRASWLQYGPPVLANGSPLSQVTPQTNVSQFFSLSVPPMPIAPKRLPAEMWKDTQWIDPGGWTTINVTTQGLPANNTNIDAAVQIASIINSTSGRRRLYFPAGVYSFKSSLAVNNKSDLWFAGAGSGNTVFRIDAPASANAEIGFRGGTSGSAIGVLGSLAAGDTVITVADASTLNVGDLIQLYADTAPLAQGGLAFVTHVYGQMCRIVGKSGNALTLDMKLLLDYPASYTPLVQRHNPIQNIKVSDLLIHRVVEPTGQDVSNLEFINAYNCSVVRVESSFAQRHHLYFQNAKDCVVESNFVHDCFVTATGGYGYGIGLVGSTGCRISHNKSTRLRHHIILQIGANHNVASYNSIEVCHDYNDLALHAAYAYMNLFEGNMLTESYADTSKDGSATVEPTTGPGNTWFRNYASGKVGSIQSATRRQNVIGNVVGTLVASGSDHYMGANLVAGVNKQFPSSWTGGTTNWGVFSGSAIFPASLYLNRKPAFLSNAPWPVFGPGVVNWGVTNVIPARAGNPAAP